MFKKYFDKTTFITGVAVALLLFVVTTVTISSIKKYQNDKLGQEEILGASYPDAKWKVVNSFNGYQTKIDDGAIPQGQNTTIFEGDRIGVRNLGYELFPPGTPSATTSPIKSIHTFRKRTGNRAHAACSGRGRFSRRAKIRGYGWKCV